MCFLQALVALLIGSALAQDEQDQNDRIRRLRFRRPRPRVVGVSDEDGQRGAPIPLRAAAGKIIIFMPFLSHNLKEPWG